VCERGQRETETERETDRETEGKRRRERARAHSIDIGSDRASGVDLSHDLLVTECGSELGEGDLGVVLHSIARGPSWVAVHAHVDVRALHIHCLVLLASDVRNAVLVDPGIGCVGVAAVARASMATVNESLDRRDDISHLALRCDFDSISNR
jgi:hypothetical protein